MGTLWGHEKISQIFKMRFLNSVTVPKNVKGGTLCYFLTSLCCKISKQMKGGPFGAIQKVSKSLSAEKKWGFGGSLVRFRGSGRLFFLVLDALNSGWS